MTIIRTSVIETISVRTQKWAVAPENIPSLGHMLPVKTHINLHIQAGWWESSLDAFCISKDAFSCAQRKLIIMKTRLFKYIKKISPPKTENIRIKNSGIFHISAENIDCGYSLEPPRRGGSNEYSQYKFSAELRKIIYTPVNPSFTI